VVDVADGQAPADGNLPHDADGLFGDEAGKAVLVGDRAGGVPALDEVSIRQIIGLVHADMQPEAVPEGRMLTAASPRHG
jgi:hypothetical protein